MSQTIDDYCILDIIRNVISVRTALETPIPTFLCLRNIIHIDAAPQSIPMYIKRRHRIFDITEKTRAALFDYRFLSSFYRLH